MTSDRIERLIAEMTPAEKLGQLQIVFRPDPDAAVQLVRDGLGSVFWPTSAARTNELQRVAVEETRLGIPLLVGLDVIHGQRTIGPVPLAQAASFDPALVEELAALAAAEARSGGVNWTFSPMVDISRDPRWGRVVEGFGEDVHLTSVMGRAMVRGYQGDDLSRPTAIAATAKHFVAYGQPEGGRDYNSVDMSEHRLRNIFLEPFRAVVDEGVASVMASFNTVAGVPMHVNRGLLTDVLKSEWGFSGAVVGDAEGVRNLLAHRVAEDVTDAVIQAFAAGLDIEMGGTPGEVAEAVLARIDGDRLDDAVRRVLRVKEALGLFENPYVPEREERTEPTAASRALVRRAAARSSVLLKSDGMLPLRAPGRVLLAGPYAESPDLLGAWTQFFAAGAGTVADEARGRGVDVTVLPGTDFFDGSDADIESAVAAARESDVAILLVGEPSALSGEAASRSDLRLPGRQEELIHAIARTETPVVVVVVTGRPLVVAEWIDAAPTVVVAWHGGTEAAAAIVDVLLGVEEPAGRLPMSWPRSVGQIPIDYAHENTGRPASVGGTLTAEMADVGLHGPDNLQEKFTSKYLDLELGPRFTFGHGSGYATFRHGAPVVSPSELAQGETARLSIDVTNTAESAGDEVIQVYVEDLVASVAPPVRRLVAFERRTIAAGQTATFWFEVGHDQLGFWRTDGAASVFTVEPGLFVLHVGSTLAATQAVELRVR